MARNKTKRKNIQPAQLNLRYHLDNGVNYIDIAEGLSRINRRGYSQSKCYAVAGVTFDWIGSAPFTAVSGTQIVLMAETAGNTWIVHNAHVKSKALWDQMNQLVLKDNPSIKGTWADFKVQLDPAQVTANTRPVRDGGGTVITGGEWELATYVLPQHEVDPVTGLPEPALERTAYLLGDDSATRVGLVKAYAESRASVQDSPSVPSALSGSFFNLLTDSGSQEPELADVIEDANDQPPYAKDDYVGGDTVAPVPFVQQRSSITALETRGSMGSFLAECGLVKFTLFGLNEDGAVLAAPEITAIVHLVPGHYKGVAAVTMGQ